MNNTEVKNTLFKLLSAPNAQAITKLVQEDDLFKNIGWWPYGNTESNFSIISTQARDSVNALVEKIVNSIDAMLLGECYKKGINPKTKQAPQTMTEGVEKFFGISKGDISQLDPKERRNLAQNIRVIADGEKDKPNLIVVDFGEGQNPDDFFKTFLSLPTEKSNKADIKFVQGKYNMGGSGALMFCGTPEQRYQLILSKRNSKIQNSKNVWGFTLVRQAVKQDSDFPLFECLVDKNGEMLTFDSEYLDILPNRERFYYGSYIKLYSYYLKNASNINLDLWRPLNRKLFIPALPITLYETRFEKEKIHGAARVMEGNKFRINGEEHKWVEKYFQIQSDLGKLGARKIEVTLFKDEIKESAREGNKFRPFPTGEFTSPTEAIFFTVNGQTHHVIGRSTLETQSNLKNLAKYLMIHIDVSNVGPYLHEIFHGAREGARNNPIYVEIEDRFFSDLRDNPVLKSLDEEYRRREIARIQPDKGFAKRTAIRILKENPEWVKQLSKGIDIPFVAQKGKKQRFIPNYIPELFKLKGDKIKYVPKNNKYSWVYFITDAPNDYLIREQDTGEFNIIPSVTTDKSYWLNEGLISLKIITPDNIKEGAKIDINAILTRPGNSDFVEQVSIQYVEERAKTKGQSQPREPQGENLNLPELNSVDKSKWNQFDPPWTAKEIARVNGSVIHINIDSYDLHNFLMRYEKRYKRSSIIEAYKTAIYLYAFILDNELSSNESQELIISENKEKLVSKLMQGISKIVLPLNFEGFLEELN